MKIARLIFIVTAIVFGHTSLANSPTADAMAQLATARSGLLLIARSAARGDFKCRLVNSLNPDFNMLINNLAPALPPSPYNDQFAVDGFMTYIEKSASHAKRILKALRENNSGFTWGNPLFDCTTAQERIVKKLEDFIHYADILEQNHSDQTDSPPFKPPQNQAEAVLK